MNPFPESDSDQETDGFDRIPDVLILLIFNQLSDIKTLTRCRAVSKRFNSLVPQAESLLVKVDCVISTETGEWFLLQIIKSILQSFQDLILPRKQILQPGIRSSPAEILRGFEKIRKLEIELPSGDLRLEKGTILRWKAEFGRTLKSCVILAVRSIEQVNENNTGDQNLLDGDLNGDEIDFHGDGSGGLKLRVVWTISALIAASARHYLLKEVIKEHREIESLILRDREGEGTVIMDDLGLREFREGEEEEEGGGGREAHVSTVGWKNRTTVPAVRMRMRHEARLDLSGGVRMKGATLVVVRPTEVERESGGTTKSEIEERKEDKCLALGGAFDGVFGEAVEALLKRRSYLLEMNSF
ncbi:F-box domain [Macleaya cordata]|uniref:F-box domain n=1 Tax=Macleaya cordata TaxID=56857 RepID=A0A200QAY4_MACCD|nr:F-box domain [Macleaya cordata]